MLHPALIQFAAETSKPDKTAFYIAAGAVVIWAFVLFAVGMRADGKWPGDARVARIIMIVSVALVAATMASAVLTG